MEFCEKIEMFLGKKCLRSLMSNVDISIKKFVKTVNSYADSWSLFYIPGHNS